METQSRIQAGTSWPQLSILWGGTHHRVIFCDLTGHAIYLTTDSKPLPISSILGIAVEAISKHTDRNSLF